MSKFKNHKRQRIEQAFVSGVSVRAMRAKTSLVVGTAFGVAALALPNCANAHQLYSNDGWEINLDTTVEYSAAFRVNSPSKVILREPNNNDGDENFKHGMTSNRFEILPVLNVTNGTFGVHISGEAYLDTSYLQDNQNTSPRTLNYFVSNNRHFAAATTNVDGRNAELLDAFAYGSHSFGDDGSQTVTLKVGRQTLLWGQSLFFTNNGIAAGQAPVDINTALTLANPQAQQVFLPVGQVVLSYQPTDWLTLQGYYQFEWRPSQLPGVGSYLASTDQLSQGTNLIYVGTPSLTHPTYAVFRGFHNPPSENGQFGLSAQFSVGDYDFGLYGLRFDAKTANTYVSGGRPTVTPFGIDVGTYYAAFKQDIQLYGASVSTNLGPAEVAGEISTRIGQGLFGPGATFVAGDNENSHPGFPYGNTLNGQVSVIYQAPVLPLMPGGASLLGEIEANRVMSVKNKAGLFGGRTADAVGMQAVFTPTYYDVLPNLNVNIPVGITWFPTGRSQFDPTMNAGTGVLNIGVTATYKTVWTFGINYKDYLGSTSITSSGQSKQPLADRGYVNAFIYRTF